MKNLTNKEWWAAAGTRAIRTWAQAFLAAIPATGLIISEINWAVAASAASVAAILSMVTSLAGLPEVDE